MSAGFAATAQRLPRPVKPDALAACLFEHRNAPRPPGLPSGSLAAPPVKGERRSLARRRTGRSDAPPGAMWPQEYEYCLCRDADAPGTFIPIIPALGSLCHSRGRCHQRLFAVPACVKGKQAARCAAASPARRQAPSGPPARPPRQRETGCGLLRVSYLIGWSPRSTVPPRVSPARQRSTAIRSATPAPGRSFSAPAVPPPSRVSPSPLWLDSLACADHKVGGSRSQQCAPSLFFRCADADAAA